MLVCVWWGGGGRGVVISIPVVDLMLQKWSCARETISMITVNQKTQTKATRRRRISSFHEYDCLSPWSHRMPSMVGGDGYVTCFSF